MTLVETVRRNLSLYAALWLASFKSKASYRADFFLMMGAAALTQGLGYIFLWVVFRQMPSVAGWTLWEAIFIYALIFMTEGFVSLFLEGMWRLSSVLHRGEFDAVLIRPVPPLIQILVCDVGLNGFGNILLGLAMMAQSLMQVDLVWTPGKILFVLVLVPSAVAIRGAMTLAASALVFWFHSPTFSAPLFVHALSSFAQFPLTIYGRTMQGLLTFVLPYAFVSYFPAGWIFGKPETGWYGLLTPLVAVYATLGAVGMFHRGIGRYEGAGS